MRTATVQRTLTGIVIRSLWSLVMMGLLLGDQKNTNGQSSFFSVVLAPARAATIPLDSLTLGAVIQINGQNFVKIGDNRYLSVCAIESNKCPVKGQEWDESAGKCVCAAASNTIKDWTGCSSLTTWTQGSSEPDDTNTICLMDSRDHQVYTVHKHSDNICYASSLTNTTPIALVQGCHLGDKYSDTIKSCYQINGCDNPTGYLQNWTDCSSLTAWSATATSGTTACLVDSRDLKTYMVRKLPDNRCWMVNNLAYGASDKYGFDVCADRTTMTNADSETNIKDKFGGQDNSTTAYGLWGDCRGNSGVADSYRDGYYYNWPAAMQQTNTWYRSSDQPANQTNVQGLCPTGWVLPTGGTATDSDFHKLATAVNGSHATSYNDATTKTFFQNSSYGWHGLYSGYTSGAGGLYFQGSSAYYGSSTFHNADNAYYLFYLSSYVNLESSNNKSYGFSIRCLFNDPSANNDDGGGGCFTAGTKITLADGSAKNIEDVQLGEMVLSYNLATKQTESSPVLQLQSLTRDHYFTLAFDDGATLGITGGHPLYTSDGWKTIETVNIEDEVDPSLRLAGQLQLGDQVLTSTGQLVAVTQITRHDQDTKVYNLSGVAGNHNFFANGRLVHNASAVTDPPVIPL